jgi:hypothetical protein
MPSPERVLLPKAECEIRCTLPIGVHDLHPDQTTLGYRRFRCRGCRRAFPGWTGMPLNRLRSLTDVLCQAVLWRPDGSARRPISSRGSSTSVPQHGRSVQQEKDENAQYCQGRHHFTHGDIHVPMVHGAHTSRSLSPRPWLTALTLQHTAGGVAPADPSTGAPPVCRSMFAPPPVLGGGLGLAPRSSARYVPVSAHQPSGAQLVAATGRPRAGETCQGAHAQSWVKCPFLGTRPGHGTGGGRRPSSRPLTRRL